jgi:hypothetical protein
MTNIGTAYTLLPIKMVWFPARHITDWGGLLNFCTHESIHLYLANTELSYRMLAAVQVQFALTLQDLLGGKKLFVPSLGASAGSLSRSARIAETIDPQVALIHELMATSLVRVAAEHGAVMVTSQIWQDILRTVLTSLKVLEENDDESSPGELGLEFFAVGPDFEEHIKQAERAWLPLYAAEFRGLHFQERYKALVAAWRKIARTVSWEEWFELVFLLARYPFDVPAPASLERLTWRTPDGALRQLEQYFVVVAAEPRDRLDQLIQAVKAADVRGSATWKDYLTDNLPGFGEWINSDRKLARFSARLWKVAGYPGIGRVFEVLNQDPFQALTILGTMPVIQKRENFPAPISLPIVLEVIRQALMAVGDALSGADVRFQGLCCLCDSSARETCDVRTVLARAWALIKPDAGYEDEFRHLWQKPICAGDDPLSEETFLTKSAH